MIKTTGTILPTITMVMFSITVLYGLVYAQEDVSQPRSLRLVTTDYLPYYGGELPNGGYITELVKETFQRAGHAVEVIFVPWKRALETAKTGEYDGLSGCFYTEARTKYFTYTESFADLRQMFFKRKGRPIVYTSLQDLQPYMIGVVRGDASVEKLKAANLMFEEVTWEKQNIQKLMYDRIALYIDTEEVTAYHLRTTFPEWKDEIEAIEPPLEIQHFYVAISKEVPDHQTIVTAFNQALQIIREEGVNTRIKQKHGF